jgi:hypothetical protein
MLASSAAPEHRHTTPDTPDHDPRIRKISNRMKIQPKLLRRFLFRDYDTIRDAYSYFKPGKKRI